MIITAPRLFAVVQISDSSLVFTSEQYTKARNFLRSLPDSIMDCFALVRYDPNPDYANIKEGNEDDHNR